MSRFADALKVLFRSGTTDVSKSAKQQTDWDEVEENEKLMAERDEQIALFNALAYHPELKWAHSVPNGFYSTPAQKRKMKEEGLKSGVWDIFVPVPRGEYHGMYLEMKFAKNKLTKEQKDFGQAMQDQGFHCRVAYGWEQAYDFICQYMGLRPFWER